MTLKQSVTIYGWMLPTELRWLAERAREHRTIVEIGSFMGRSTMALAETPGTVYAIDTWAGSDEREHVELLEGRDDTFLYHSFMLNLSAQVESGKVRPMRVRSPEVTIWFNPVPPPDMIFIDGSHDYANVCADILAWSKLLAPGGLLCGHDYYESATWNAGWEGVRRAVNELVPGFKVYETIWYRDCREEL